MDQIGSNAKATILGLLSDGVSLIPLTEEEQNTKAHEKLARRVICYVAAANALLGGLGELHNELVEHPDFMVLRRVERKYPF